jgi:hypothetical protein
MPIAMGAGGGGISEASTAASGLECIGLTSLTACVGVDTGNNRKFRLYYQQRGHVAILVPFAF